MSSVLFNAGAFSRELAVVMGTVRDSQARRVLMVLRDRFGGWVSIDEIHAHAGSMRLNSRVSDLRKQGFVVEHRQRGHVHEYRLLGRERAPLEEPTILGGVGSSSSESPHGRRFVPARASAVRMVGDGAGYSFAVVLAPGAGAAWSGADAASSISRGSAAAGASSASAPVLALVDAPPGEQLSLEAA